MKYLMCKNSNSIYGERKPCNEKVYVDDHIVKVLCWRCTAEMLPMPERRIAHNGYPRGWKFMKVFVDKDGNVFHKGIQQEDLFGTLPPTKLDKKTNKKKTEKQTMNEKIMVEVAKKISKKRKQYKGK